MRLIAREVFNIPASVEYKQVEFPYNFIISIGKIISTDGQHTECGLNMIVLEPGLYEYAGKFYYFDKIWSK